MNTKTYQYFSDVTNAKEAKKRRDELVKIYHESGTQPNEEAMKIINSEYDDILIELESQQFEPLPDLDKLFNEKFEFKINEAQKEKLKTGAKLASSALLDAAIDSIFLAFNKK